MKTLRVLQPIAFEKTVLKQRRLKFENTCRNHNRIDVCRSVNLFACLSTTARNLVRKCGLRIPLHIVSGAILC